MARNEERACQIFSSHGFEHFGPTGSSGGGELWLWVGDDDAPPKSVNWPHRSHSKAASQCAAVHLSGRPQIGHGTDSDLAARSTCKRTSFKRR